MIKWMSDKYGRPVCWPAGNGKLFVVVVNLKNEYIGKEVKPEYIHLSADEVPNEFIIFKGNSSNVETAKKECEYLIQSFIGNLDFEKTTEESTISEVIVDLEGICKVEHDKIKFTTNGKPIVSCSKIYKEAFAVKKGTTVKWVAFLNNIPVDEGSYQV